MAAQRIVEMTLIGEAMAVQDSALDRFSEFVAQHEARLRESLMATCGGDAGREAAVEALLFAWDNLDRLEPTAEPLSHLYTVGLASARDGRTTSKPVFDRVETALIPDVDPDLPDSLSRLPEPERVPVVLVHGFQWTQPAVAALLGLGAATAKGYLERGMERLSSELDNAPSITIERQLADYGFWQRQLHGAVSADEVLERLRRTDMQVAIGAIQERTRPASRTRPPRLLRVAAVAAILVVFGGAAFALRATETDSDVSDSGQTRRVETSNVAFDQPFDLEISSVTVGGPGFVAVGSYMSRGQRSVATIWTSVDAVTWSRIPHDEDVFGLGVFFSDELSMTSITAGGPGFVATGWGTPWRDAPGDGFAAVWTSVDGIAWSRVHHQAPFNSAEMSAVIATDSGLIAVGRTSDSNAAVWTSSDGSTWSRVPTDPTTFDDAVMSNVAAGGPGLVAVGEDHHGNSAVWISSGGTDWTRIPHDANVFGSSAMTSVTAWGTGLVAVGYRVTQEMDHVEPPMGVEAAVWMSADGITWSRVDVEAAFDGAEMASVAATPSGLVAVGSVAAGFGRYPAVWTSTDGITWAKEPELDTESGPAEIRGVTAATVGRFAPQFPGGAQVRGLIAVGSAGSDAAVWVIHPLSETCLRRMGDLARERLGCYP